MMTLRIARSTVRLTILALLVVPRLSVPSTAAGRQGDDLAAVPRISQADFKKALADGSVLVLDVRDAASYGNGHIAGAVSIPLDELQKHLRELKAERRPIVTYCA